MLATTTVKQFIAMLLPFFFRMLIRHTTENIFPLHLTTTHKVNDAAYNFINLVQYKFEIMPTKWYNIILTVLKLIKSTQPSNN